MVKIKTFLDKLHRKWIKLRLQPIRIFCLHHVCEQFNAESMYQCDWMELSCFKEKINALRSHGYKFISLKEAYNHLNSDWFRRKKYAVLTFDDGYKSLLDILPWLEKQNIPATLFVNGKYLDGKSYRESPKEQYLTYEELSALNSPLIEIGHHGWEHTDATKMTKEELRESVHKNIEILSSHPRYISFWAYTWGRYTVETNQILRTNEIIPVYVNGMKNYTNEGFINRELL